MIKLHTRVAACAFVGMCACRLSATRVVAQEPAKQATAAKDAQALVHESQVSAGKR